MPKLVSWHCAAPVTPARPLSDTTDAIGHRRATSALRQKVISSTQRELRAAPIFRRDQQQPFRLSPIAERPRHAVRLRRAAGTVEREQQRLDLPTLRITRVAGDDLDRVLDGADRLVRGDRQMHRAVNCNTRRDTRCRVTPYGLDPRLAATSFFDARGSFA